LKQRERQGTGFAHSGSKPLGVPCRDVRCLIGLNGRQL
jgi:hypothetical protein